MTYITHSLGGLAAGLAAVAFIGDLDEIATGTVIAGAVLGSLLPDIDHAQSYISKKYYKTSRVTAKAFRHRGFTHTPLFIILVTVIGALLVPFLIPASQQTLVLNTMSGLIPGMLSHIVLDTFNKQGIPWFWPITKKKYSLAPITTGSSGEKVFALCLAVGISYFFFY